MFAILPGVWIGLITIVPAAAPEEYPLVAPKEMPAAPTPTLAVPAPPPAAARA